MVDVNEVFEKVSSLTVKELAQLNKMLEEQWGVSGSAVVVASGNAGGAVSDAGVSEKTSYDVVLKSAGANKVAVIKIVKDIKGCSLIDAKKDVDGAPSVIQSGVDKEKAEDMKKKLEESGASVELK